MAHPSPSARSRSAFDRRGGRFDDLPARAVAPAGGVVYTTRNGNTVTTWTGFFLRGAPADAQVRVDGSNVPLVWQDDAHTTRVIAAAPGSRILRVDAPGQAPRQGTYTVEQGSMTDVTYSAMAPLVVGVLPGFSVPVARTSISTLPLVLPPAPEPPPTIQGVAVVDVRIEGMPITGQVYVDNVPATGTWEGSEKRVWVVPIAAGTHVLRITQPGAPARSLTVALTGPLTLRYDALPVTPVAPKNLALPPAESSPPPPPPPPPAEPVAGVLVVLTTAQRLPGGRDRAVVLLDATGTRTPLVLSDDGTRGSARVPAGRYTVEVTDETGETRTADLPVDADRTLALDALRWRYASRGTVVLTDLPPDPSDAPYRAELVGEGPRQGLAFPFLPLPSGDRVAYPLPGRYTLRVFQEPSGAAPRLVRLADVTATAHEFTSVAFPAMEVAASAPASITPAMPAGPTATPPSSTPTSTLTVQGVPDGWTLRIDGRPASATQPLTIGPHVVLALDPTQRVAVTRTVTMSSEPQTLDLTQEVGRAMAFANGRQGLVGVTAQGQRRGYLADVTRRTMTLAEPAQVVQEFEVIGRDAAGRMLAPFFLRGHGMVLLPVTAQEFRALLAQILPSRGRLRADLTYPFELTLGAAPTAAAPV